jgi:hypothetical protein
VLFAVLVCAIVLARREFGRSIAAPACLLLMAVFPFWAFWAARLTSDTLHVALLSAFAVTWFVERPSWRRTAVAGALLALASFVRPYTILLPIALGAVRLTPSRRDVSLRQVVALVLLASSLVGFWVVRNQYYFGRPMITSMGPGYGFWLGAYEATRGPFGQLDYKKVDEDQGNLGVKDQHWISASPRLIDASRDLVRGHETGYLSTVLLRTLRLWLPQGDDVSAAGQFLLLACFGLVLAAMVAGTIVVLRANRPSPLLAGSVVIVGYYTAVFCILHTESRYVLPARTFGFILAIVGAAHVGRFVWCRLRPRSLQPSS